MAKFITRILLLKGEEKDYETLHREIAKDRGVLKKKKIMVASKLAGGTPTKASAKVLELVGGTPTKASAKVLELVGGTPTKALQLVGGTPTKAAEFNYWGNITLKDVADAVVRAVRKTGRDYSFTIMKDKEDYKPGHG